MKKFLIALSITLLAFGPIIAKKGAWIHNKITRTVPVKIDNGIDKDWIELRPGTKRFFKISTYGKGIGIYHRTSVGKRFQDCKTKKYKNPTDFIINRQTGVTIKTKSGKTYTEKFTRECDVVYPRTIKLPNYDKIYERLKPLLKNKNLTQTDEKRKAIVNLYYKSRGTQNPTLYNKINKAFHDEGSSIGLMMEQVRGGKVKIKFEK